MKAVILDGYTTVQNDLSWRGLDRLLDGDLTVYDRTSPAELLNRARGADILITNKVVLNAETLNSLPELKYISTLSTGYNVIDIVEAARLGIPVSNIPAYSTDSVAQTVFALMLEYAQQAGTYARSVRAGDWANSADFCYVTTPLVELAGKTLGIVGYGTIGKKVARIAVAFGMKVLAYSPSFSAPDGVAAPCPLDTLLSSSDFVTFHCRMNDLTKGIINGVNIAKMKDGAVVINTARGGLTDEIAVAEALKRGKLGAYCADVALCEPPRDNTLINAPNTYFTPHIAWATKEARSRLIQTLESNIRGFLTGNIINRVN